MTAQEHHQHKIAITIADFTIELHTTSAELANRLRERYADFLDSIQRPILTIELSLVADALYIPPRPGRWIIESNYEESRLTYRSYTEQGHVDWQTNHGFLEMRPDAHVENFLRVIFAWLCLKHQGLLLHGAGLVRNQQGYVFFGPSGAGKTTTTRLSAPVADILSDDLVILRPRNGHCQLYGVPFRGELSEAPRANQQAPLKGIFRLRQDTAHFLQPLSTTVATAELVASSPFVVRELKLSQQLITVCKNIVQTVPIQELHFRRDNGFWQVIDGYYQDVSPTPSANGRPGL